MVLRKLSQTLRITLALVVATFSSGLLQPAVAYAADDNKCVGLVSGKIDTTGDPATVTMTAPSGMVIDSYCVKSGSAGPVYVTLATPVNSITVGYPGKDSVSHYSYSYISAPTTTVTATEPSVTPVCGPNNDTVTIPTQTGVTYNAGAWAGGSRTVTATAQAGYTLTGTTSWTYTDMNVACPDSDKVTLCHATGSEKNPFVRITVDAEGAFNGHLGEDHQGGEDIIPPFTYEGEVYSQNWTEGMVLTEECDVAELVVPAQVQFLNPTCENPTGRVVITATEGITYKVGDTVVTGTVSYPAGTTVTVTAHVTDESYVIDEETDISWTHMFTSVPTNCLLGTNDVCPNIEGTQTVIPSGYTQNVQTGDCFVPGRGGATPVLGAATAAVLPAVLPSTGGVDSPFMILVASMLAFGATYFLQGKRLLGRREALEA